MAARDSSVDAKQDQERRHLSYKIGQEIAQLSAAAASQKLSSTPAGGLCPSSVWHRVWIPEVHRQFERLSGLLLLTEGTLGDRRRSKLEFSAFNPHETVPIKSCKNHGLDRNLLWTGVHDR